MTVKIRLRRTGAKKQPHYRVIVAESTSPRDGAFLETIGHYHPLTEPATIVINEDKVRYWLERGAQPTETVVKLLKKSGAAERIPQLKKYVRAEEAQS